jgi:membrane protein YqaA with SNARE-associated domain
VTFPKDTLAALLAALGPWAPFWIAFADSSFLPLAQAVDVMVVAQAILFREQAYTTAAMAVGGSTLGCFAAYLAARRAGPWMIEKYLAPARRQSFEESFRRYGAWHLVVQTMVPLPLPMRLSLLGAGAFRMHPLRFLAAILFARAVRYFGLALVTIVYGERAILFWRERAWALAGLLLAGLAVWLVWEAVPAARAWGGRRRCPSTARYGEVDLGRSAFGWHEQTAKKLVQAHAGREPACAATPARMAHGDRQPGVIQAPHPRPPDSGSPLQSGVHVLQRV